MASNGTTSRNAFVIDRHPVVRQGLAEILSSQREILICGETEDVDEASRQITVLKPDVLITDLSIGNANGLDFIESFRRKFARLPILIFTAMAESYYAERALRAGANGYVMKSENAQTILMAVQRVLEGKTYLSPHQSEQVLRRFSDPNRNTGVLPIQHQLSPRELSIFELMGYGYSSRKIADQLNMSIKTVAAHRLNIRKKLLLKNTVALVQRAIEWVHYEGPGRLLTPGK